MAQEHRIFKCLYAEKRPTAIFRKIYPHLKHQSVSLVLDFIYTGYLDLPTSIADIRFFLNAAKAFQIENFNKYVESELANRITSENYVELWEIAEQFTIIELEQHLQTFVAFSIEELWRCVSQFSLLHLSWLLRVCIVGSASPSVSAESLVQAILSWFRSTEAINEEDITQFLPYLHLADCSEEFLKDLWKNEELIKKLRPLKRELYNAIISQRHGKETTDLKCSKIINTNRKKCFIEKMITVKNQSLNNLSPNEDFKINLRSPRTNSEATKQPTVQHSAGSITWRKKIKENVSNFKCSTLVPVSSIRTKTIGKNVKEQLTTQKKSFKNLWNTEEKISCTAFLVILGRRKNGDVAMRCFNPDESVWLPAAYVVPSITHADDSNKFYHGARLLEGAAAAAHGAILYLAGGILDPTKDRRPCSSVLAYDVTVSVLKELPSMSSARAVAGAAVLDDYLYVVGGTGKKGKPMNLVERYDVKKKEWASVQPLPQPCWEMGVAACSGRLFACGGRCRAEWTQACYSYNPETNQWLRIDALPTQEFDNTYPIVSSYNNCLYAVRHQNPKICAHICRFRFAESKWTFLRTSSGVGPKNILALLPWNEKLWTVDMLGKICCYDLACQRWSSTVSMLKCMPYPLYAAILISNER